MQIRNISIGLVVLALFVVAAPTTTHAYQSTGHSQTVVTDSTAIFTISYQFGIKDHDIYLPVFTGVHADQNDKLGYTVEEDSIPSVRGTSAGLVLSDAEIVDGMYKIPADTAALFTVLVFYKADDKSFGGDYNLKVESLPFMVDYDGEIKQRALTDGELKYYETDLVRLN